MTHPQHVCVYAFVRDCVRAFGPDGTVFCVFRNGGGGGGGVATVVVVTMEVAAVVMAVALVVLVVSLDMILCLQMV